MKEVIAVELGVYNSKAGPVRQRVGSKFWIEDHEEFPWAKPVGEVEPVAVAGPFDQEVTLGQAGTQKPVSLMDALAPKRGPGRPKNQEKTEARNLDVLTK